MARPKGSRNKPKDSSATEAQKRDADVADPADAIESMAARTLRGDIRDALLAEFKALQVAWSFMTEDEQERVIHRCEDIASGLVNRAVLIAAAEGASSLTAEIGQFTVKDGLKVQMNATATVEHITRLAEHHGPAVIVLVDPSKFRGQRAPAQTDVVGDLKMPRQAPGVHGDELPDGPIIDVEATEVHDDDLDIPGSPRRLPPPPNTNPPPFNDFDDEGPRHI